MKEKIFYLFCKLFPNHFKIYEWDDDMIWCPSQCYLNVQIKNRYYTVYLRWRWNDPWSAAIYETDNKFQSRHNLKDRTPLFVNFYKDDQVEDLKKEAFKLFLKKKFTINYIFEKLS